jgi:hypothetical protein
VVRACERAVGDCCAFVSSLDWEGTIHAKPRLTPNAAASTPQPFEDS